MTSDFRKKLVPNEFDSPEQLPGSLESAQKWQDANRAFWESHPMRYDWKESIGHPEYTEEFYKEIDKRFFSNVWEYMPWQTVPFDTLINFDDLRHKKVLEIGVGNGSHAYLLAGHSDSYTGIDLTSYAVNSTAKRLELFDIPAKIMQMDAEAMAFPDSSFDFVWSWGVIHHSSNTKKILEEMHRVLKSGGEAIIMVYHRGLWNYYFCGGLIRGVVLGDLLRTHSLAKTVQRHTDGALARYYTIGSLRLLLEETGFKIDYVIVKGSKAELLPMPGGKLKSRIMALLPNAITRFFTNHLRMGSFLICKFAKA